ncbi:hypothetical protein RSAG8_08152, partial [Rhizoctonia solani AG-8 WAC10335]
MSDPSIVVGPFHPDVLPFLDPEYAAFHDKHLADRPAIHKAPYKKTDHPFSRPTMNPGNYYLPDKSTWTHVDASPLFQKDAQVWRELPDAWVGVAALDILRSEGEAYAQKLKEAGKNVEVVVYPGAPHTIMAMDEAIKIGFQLGEDAAQALYKAFYPS